MSKYVFFSLFYSIINVANYFSIHSLVLEVVRSKVSSNQIKMLEWPPQSWGYLDDKMHKTSLTTRNNHFETLETACEHINPEYLKKLVESMPRRLEAVLKAKGGHTKYWKLKKTIF